MKEKCVLSKKQHAAAKKQCLSKNAVCRGRKCQNGSCVYPGTCCPGEVTCNDGTCLTPANNLTCAQVATAAQVLNLLGTFKNSSDAIASSDPNLLNSLVDIIHSRTSGDLQARITAQSVIDILYPNPNVTFDFTGLGNMNISKGNRALSTIATRDLSGSGQLPAGCLSAIDDVVFEAIFFGFAVAGISNSAAAQATSAALTATAASEPMMSNLFTIAKYAWAKGQSFESITYASMNFAYIAKFFGVQFLIREWESHLPNADAMGGFVPLTLSMITLVVTDGMSLANQISEMAQALADFAGAVWDCLDACTPPVCSLNTTILANCDDGDKCTLDQAICGTSGWTCQHTPVSCPKGLACDSADGQCKGYDELVPCVAVIDEDESFGYPNQTDMWSEFRAAYPSRPFCLLVPGPEGYVQIPDAFKSDPNALVLYDIPRDYGQTTLRSDWVDLCDLGGYTPTTVPWVAVFVDDSGSLMKYEVNASYNLLVSELQNQGIGVKDVVNADENWILPFLTTLAPTSGCTAEGKPGTCQLLSTCAALSKQSVPYKFGDPEPSCRSLPYEYQCCVPYSCVAGGTTGECLSLTECMALGKMSVPWNAGDPQPNCENLPYNVQCCI